MADRHVDHLLIGGGVAAAACATELRERGAEGSVLLVGREPDPPYDRPPLSKEYLRGQASLEDALWRPSGWYEERDIEVLTRTNVMSLDPQGRVAKLQTKEEVSFDTVLLATGAMVQILRVDGAQLDGIHYLRTFGNADAIREDTRDAEHVVLVGGSFIAAECAASLTAEGTRCTMVMMEEAPFATTLGVEAAEWFRGLLSQRGVGVITGETVDSFQGPEEGRVEGVRAQSGLEVPCDAVIVGAGVRPDVMLAQRAGLETGDGIVCDEALRTSAEGAWAAGDVCSYESVLHGRRLRVEHWDAAFQQGRHVARAMLGEAGAFAEVPYFWSDLADWARIEYVGPAERWDETVWRGDEEAFSLWYLNGGHLAGALAVGRPGDLVPARRFLASGTDLSEHRAALGDTGSDLDALG